MYIDRLIARDRRPSARRNSPVVERMEDRKLLSYVYSSSSRVVEGTGGTSTMEFVVKLVAPSTTTVRVDYGTVDVTAKAGQDYIATSGTLTFAPGETSKTVPVSVIPDSVCELTETFGLTLKNGGNAQILTSTVGGTILDDDAPVLPALTINDVTMTRGLSGSRIMTFTVGLNAAQRTPVSVTAATSNLTAIAGKDYAAKTELLTFAPGETSKSFNVTIYGSATTGDKYFFVKLSGTTATLTRANAAGIMKYGA